MHAVKVCRALERAGADRGIPGITYHMYMILRTVRTLP